MYVKAIQDNIDELEAWLKDKGLDTSDIGLTDAVAFFEEKGILKSLIDCEK